MAVWLLLLGANRRAPAAELSHNLFVTLGILALAFCLVAGIFLTADCLSGRSGKARWGCCS